MEDLPSNTEHYSAQEHNGKHILQTSQTVNTLTEDANDTGDDHDDSRADFVNEHASDQGHDNVGEGIERIKEVELGLTHFLIMV